MKLKTIVLTMCLIIMAAYNAHAQTQTGYRVPPRADIGGGRMTGDMWCQYGTNGVRFKIGTQAVTQVGTVGVINGTNVTGLPSLDFTYGGGSMSANFNSFNAVYVAGSQVGTSGALTGKLDAVDGVGTNNTFNNPTLAGVGTITASFGANGLVISPAEYASVNNASSELQAQVTTATGSITNHTHTGSDGTTQVSHTNLTNKGTQTHTQIDDFIASKASASGLASLDTNSLVAQNLASGTSTPGANKTVMSDGTSKISDNWLSNNVTKLGTPTTDNISEGSTNKYYTDDRVNTAVGSLSINALTDVVISSPSTGQFVWYNGANWINGTSSASVAFSEVTGSASASQLPLISGLLGSATSAQLPTVIRLPGTTTEPNADAAGQLYVHSKNFLGEMEGGDTKLLLHMNNPGTTTFVDSSASAYTVTAVNNTIGTTTAKFGSGGGYFDGTTDYLSIADSADWFLDTGNFTIDLQMYFITTNIQVLSGQLTATDNIGHVFYYDSGQLWFRSADAGSWKADYRYTWTPTLRQFYHIEVGRSGTNLYLFIDGDLKTWTTISTAISTNSLPDMAATLQIGYSTGGYPYSLNGIIDEYRWSKGIARHTSSFTALTASYGSHYTQYATKYKDPVNGNTVFEILTPGTATTEASYIYCNATTTVFGIGTNTAITATSTAYSGWFDGAVRATAFNVASTEKIKENIKTIKIKPDLLDAEELAKQNYIAGAKMAWVAANQANYQYVGSDTATYVDTITMESDYNNYIEFGWASDLNQDSYIENIQKTYEKGFWQMFDSVTPRSWNPKDKPTLTRKGFVVEDMPDVVKGDDGQSIDPMALIAYISVVQQTLKADMIFALSTLKELIMTGTVTQQKIDYVQDRMEVLNP